jgi:hypothetical protein
LGLFKNYAVPVNLTIRQIKNKGEDGVTEGVGEWEKVSALKVKEKEI